MAHHSRVVSTTAGLRRRLLPDGASYRQAAYYRETAKEYESSHVAPGDEHFVALRYVDALMAMLGVHTVLDVGTGTGRSIRYLKERGHYELVGVDPVAALLDEAALSGASGAGLVRASATALPFRTGSFDAVCSTGVLHHVRHPGTVVEEMLRVARRAVFISDSNRFGQGRLPARLTKLALAKAGLWRAFVFVRTGGRGYQFSEGDGVFYSYSVFDSLPRLAGWGDRTIVIGTGAGGGRRASGASWFNPLLTSGHVLACAVREAPEGPRA